MNIGFHYFITKILAVEAGFNKHEAELIAYACQYVDDAVLHKKMKIDNLPDPLYERMDDTTFDPTCTSHKGLNNVFFNRESIRNKILLPFHFIPIGMVPNSNEYNYLTIADSEMARNLVNIAMSDYLRGANKELALIRIGVALHSYEDSFSHQGFSSLNSKEHNGVSQEHIISNYKQEKISIIIKLKGLLGFRIGHALLYTYPDRFNTEISYFNGAGNILYINTVNMFAFATKKTYDLLRKCTGANDNWALLYPKIKHCLSKNYKSTKGWNKLFSKYFPDINYSYNDSSWINQAIKRNITGGYRFVGDMKWFHFHLASYEQRKIMMLTL